MCGTCGCGDSAVIRLAAPGEPDGTGLDYLPVHDHPPGHDHAAHGPGGHDHGGHGPDGDGRTVVLQQKILAKNDELAGQNRAWLGGRGVFAVNLMSSPGAGKTTLLQHTAAGLAGTLALSVIEGDQETALDAERIRSAGCRVAQINTGAGCHLDAAMVGGALRALDPPPGSMVVIENVGNLVCPALFDLGEGARVVLGSVTEGADKPVKYPHMFHRADLVLVTKTDLLPYVDFQPAAFSDAIGKVAPAAEILQLSATTGDGLPGWYAWLRQRARPAVR
ncbi:MAG TPA: hydrogenase nickel incorporation protein HypB [Streptosporangiaceae bacterium]